MNKLLRILKLEPIFTATDANKLTIESQIQTQLNHVKRRSERGIFYDVTEKKDLCVCAMNDLKKRGFTISNHNEEMYKISW